MLLAAKLAEVFHLLIAQPSRRLAVQRNAWAGRGHGARPAEAEQLGGGALYRNNTASTASETVLTTVLPVRLQSDYRDWDWDCTDRPPLHHRSVDWSQRVRRWAEGYARP